MKLHALLTEKAGMGSIVRAITTEDGLILALGKSHC